MRDGWPIEPAIVENARLSLRLTQAARKIFMYFALLWDYASRSLSEAILTTRATKDNVRIHKTDEESMGVMPASEVISHYRIIRKLGAGGIGEGYLIEDARPHRVRCYSILPGEKRVVAAAKVVW
jgi:hypothetical protein